MSAKYELLPKKLIEHPLRKGILFWACRIRALVDIPLHGVKAGDTGGYLGMGYHHLPLLKHPEWLSQEGNAWVGGDAFVYNTHISGNALIKDNAVVYGTVSPFSGNILLNIYGDTTVFGKAQIYFKKSPRRQVNFSGGASIGANAKIIDPSTMAYDFFMGGNAVLSGKNIILNNGSRVVGNAHIESGVVVGYGSYVVNARLKRNTRVKSRHMVCLIDGEVTTMSLADVIKNISRYHKSQLGKKSVKAVKNSEPKSIETPESVPTASLQTQWEYVSPTTSDSEDEVLAGNEETREYEISLKEIQEKVDSYQNDIVKILQYPVMVDFTDEYTVALMDSLRKASRISPTKNPDKFILSVEDLETKFMMAESNALRIAKTYLSEINRKKVETANQLFALAENESATIHERSSAFKQGFRNLEGIIGVPEKAIEAFKQKTGLLEIEA